MTTTSGRPFITNNTATVDMPTGQFMVEQRNVGFADNDGRWLVTQSQELYWDSCGFLMERRPSRFLGAFDSLTIALRVAREADKVPAHQIPDNRVTRPIRTKRNGHSG